MSFVDVVDLEPIAAAAPFDGTLALVAVEDPGSDSGRDGFGLVGDGDGSLVPVGVDDPDPAFTEDLRESGGSDPQPGRGGDPGFPERRGGQVGVDEDLGHRYRSAFLPGFGAAGEGVGTDRGEGIGQLLALGLAGKTREFVGFLP
jgi:hypothetical protein